MWLKIGKKNVGEFRTVRWTKIGDKNPLFIVQMTLTLSWDKSGQKLAMRWDTEAKKTQNGRTLGEMTKIGGKLGLTKQARMRERPNEIVWYSLVKKW